MPSTIEAYREAKTSYLKLRNEAKQELIARFNELANELLQLQRELLEDFGQKVTIPTKAKKPKAVKPAATKAAAAPVTPAAEPKVSAKSAGLRKQLDRQKKRLTELQAAGKPTKSVEDRIYEIEDELRLSLSGE